MPDTLNCPVCGTELLYKDYYGHITGWNALHNDPIISHEGDIFYCDICDENYFEDGEGKLVQGYPC